MLSVLKITYQQTEGDDAMDGKEMEKERDEKVIEAGESKRRRGKNGEKEEVVEE